MALSLADVQGNAYLVADEKQATQQESHEVMQKEQDSRTWAGWKVSNCIRRSGLLTRLHKMQCCGETSG